ncbi:MAG: hypothetical protein HYY79_09595 [Betaproteobacteria bacterium]|nr:hypothetical protein [Betaproteobacteria bacterium]
MRSVKSAAARSRARHPHAQRARLFLKVQDLERQNGNFRLLATMTQMGKSARKWEGETRMLDADLVRHCVGDIKSLIYHLAGPPAMVDAMQEMLRRAGIAESDIRSEEFYGY